MDITNKTRKPLSLALPGGKKLFLGPGQTGQVSPKALAHPPLARLLEAGDLETSTSAVKHKGGGGGSVTGAYQAPHRGETGAKRQSGDR